MTSSPPTPDRLLAVVVLAAAVEAGQANLVAQQVRALRRQRIRFRGLHGSGAAGVQLPVSGGRALWRAGLRRRRAHPALRALGLQPAEGVDRPGRPPGAQGRVLRPQGRAPEDPDAHRLPAVQRRLVALAPAVDGQPRDRKEHRPALRRLRLRSRSRQRRLQPRGRCSVCGKCHSTADRSCSSPSSAGASYRSRPPPRPKRASGPPRAPSPWSCGGSRIRPPSPASSTASSPPYFSSPSCAGAARTAGTR